MLFFGLKNTQARQERKAFSLLIFTTIHYSLTTFARHIMSSKRKYQESMNEEIVHPSRQSQVPGSKPTPSKKPRQTEAPVYRRQVHASSVNAIKKRIRDVTRRLERSDDIPANVRVDDERALTAYQQELAAADAEKSRQKMIKRYHMVRFFGMARYIPFHFLCRLLIPSRTPKSNETFEKASEEVAGD